MSREWQPGDVAMVLNEHGVWNRAIYSVKPIGMVWQYGVADSIAPMNADAQPLVVLDPEDAEQIGRLAKAWHEAEYAELGNTPMSLPQYRLQAALREFANPTPPKPDEPTGRYAVVVDANGNEWLRTAEGSVTPWLRSGYFAAQEWTNYADITAVRVLSEGVS